MRNSRRIALSLGLGIVCLAAAQLAGEQTLPGEGDLSGGGAFAFGLPSPSDEAPAAVAGRRWAPDAPDSEASRAAPELPLSETPASPLAERLEAAGEEVRPGATRAPEPGGVEPGAASAPLVLEALLLEQDGHQLRVAGRDRQAPRALFLWRTDDSDGLARSARLARGESRPDGVLVMPPLRVPRDGLTVVVAPEGVAPGEPGASSPLSVEARVPRAPAVRRMGGAQTSPVLRILPRTAGGRIELAGADQRVFTERNVPIHPDAAARAVEVALEAEPAGDLLVRQVLADGRASAWRPVSIRADQGEPDR